MKRFIDKIQALWVVLTAKEYAIYTCKNFNDASTADCWLSYGLNDLDEGSIDFFGTINEFNTKHISNTNHISK